MGRGKEEEKLTEDERRALRGSRFAPLPPPPPSSSRFHPRLAHPGGPLATNKAAALAKFLERKLQEPGGLSSINPDLVELAVKNAKETLKVSTIGSSQLLRILILLDYLSTCALREKYGRFRPWHNPLSRKLDGWQRMWWHYAQESILSDVRRKLRKTSWSNFGRRLSYRRKYVSLYKRKLELLHQE